ncbi:MAG TPA: cupin domain-containing protein, partial [Bryobacterales bacterium]|nr:cupin domain-containing protein [Bryobacterales bacterium]
GRISLAVAHKSVEEIWYFLEGRGEVWRKQGEDEEVTTAVPGVSLAIPAGAHFQFRNTGAIPLRFLCVTVPAWPGEDEACRVEDHWAVEL